MDLCFIGAVGKGAVEVGLLVPVCLQLVSVAQRQFELSKFDIGPDCKQMGVGVGDCRLKGAIGHGVFAIQVPPQEGKGFVDTIFCAHHKREGIMPVPLHDIHRLGRNADRLFEGNSQFSKEDQPSQRRPASIIKSSVTWADTPAYTCCGRVISVSAPVLGNRVSIPGTPAESAPGISKVTFPSISISIWLR